MNSSSNTTTKRSQRDCTMGFKLIVVALVKKGEMTYKQAQEHYGIQGVVPFLFGSENMVSWIGRTQ